MMSEYPLAIRYKKEEYICRGFFVVRGRFLMFWSCGAFRLYLAAYLHFLAHDVLCLDYSCYGEIH